MTIDSTMTHQRPVLEAAKARLEAAITEAAVNLTTSCADPWERFRDPTTGEFWPEVGGGDCRRGGLFSDKTLTTQEQLDWAQSESRSLVASNEWAINAIENRISYVVGTGHVYTVQDKPDHEVSDEKKEDVQKIIDTFLKANRWQHRQQETQRRLDRDGEVFRRIFPDDEVGLRIRFVEPSQIATPDNDDRPEASWGIVTDPDDVETIEGYYVDEKLVDAEDIQHRKLSTDAAVKRGAPLFFPVAPNLKRAERLLRNMSTVAEIQTAIALIRKHEGGTSANVDSFVTAGADASVTNSTTGNTRNFRRYGPGTILDAPGGVEYDFPAQGLNAGNYVMVLQAELRAVASRLVMPEFMLTSDASNNNFASILVSEGPADKMFQRLQAETIEADIEIMDVVLDWAVSSGQLDEATRDMVEIDVEAPRTAALNRKDETDADIALKNAKGMSQHTLIVRAALDPDFELEKMEEEQEKNDPFAGMGGGFGNPMQPGFGAQNPNGGEDDGKGR